MKWKYALGTVALASVSAFAAHSLTLAWSAPQDPAQEMSEEEYWAEAMRLAQPASQHEELQNLTGDWDIVMNFKMSPDAPPEKAEASGTYEPILGGRFLKWQQKGTFMGMPLDGMMILGYDNLTKQYMSLWMDSMSTGMYLATGTADEDGVITQEGIMKDPMTPKGRPYKTITRNLGEDDMSFEMWDTVPSGPNKGEMVKSMWITYTRK